jgi:hypothetical protein
MKFCSKKFEFESRRASALVLSFFVMSMLILVAVGVNFLVVRDMETVTTLKSGLQSRYAAEGISELGLYGIEENLPGFEPSYENYGVGANALASLEVDARGWSVPCGGEDQWRTLSKNESVQLALFAQTDAAGSMEKINDFYVRFYVTDSNGSAVNLSGDVLRWKVLGFVNSTTEAISEYIPLHPSNVSTDVNPTIFGSSFSEGATLTEYAYGKYYQRIDDSYYVFQPVYSIRDFLTGHDYNYLILTNVMSGSGDYDIQFQLYTINTEAVCEYVTLDALAVNDVGDTQQMLETMVREGENLPVFDFVLYHTADD